MEEPHSTRRLEIADSVLVGGDFLGSDLRLFLCQIIIIVGLSQLLGLILQKVHQPRVIAEVLAGILLGPTAFGAIPGFTGLFFPASSITPLQLTAELGLMAFLFVVGLELDLSYVSGKDVALLGALSFTGQGFCWIISLPISYLLYNTLMQDFDTELFSVILFIGVAMSVTALPVLSRILSEGRLLDTKVGMAAVSAAVFDDLAAWCLLALTISITSGGEPIEALYVFLATAGFAAIMFTVGRNLLRWALYKLNGMKLPGDNEEQRVFIDAGGDEDTFDDAITPHRSSNHLEEPVEHPEAVTSSSVTLCLLVAVAAGYITEVIGVSPIFGAFITGIIVPREAGGFFTVGLTEKVEDVTGSILLPLYFATSGLKTNFLKLNTAKMWGLAALVFMGACIGKIAGGAFFTKLKGLTRRECLCIGILMNARGLVELIILNAGLNAGVIDGDTFSIMVLMAVGTTFMTSPIVRWVYPPKYRRPAVDVDFTAASTPEKQPGLSSIAGMLEKSVEETTAVSDVICQSIRLLVLLPERETGVYGICRVFRMLLTKTAPFLAVRLFDVGVMDHERISATMKLQASQDTVFTSMKRFHGETDMKHHVLLVGGREEDSTPQAIAGDIYKLADSRNSNTIFLPLRGSRLAPNVLEYLMEARPSGTHARDGVMPGSGCTVACLIDPGTPINRRPQLIVPFRGGADDRDALLLAMVMSKNGAVQLTVIVSSNIEGVSYGNRGGGGGNVEVKGGTINNLTVTDEEAEVETGPANVGETTATATSLDSVRPSRSFSASQNQPWSMSAASALIAPSAQASSSPDVLLLKAVEGFGAHVLFAVDMQSPEDLAGGSSSKANGGDAARNMSGAEKAKEFERAEGGAEEKAPASSILGPPSLFREGSNSRSRQESTMLFHDHLTAPPTTASTSAGVFSGAGGNNNRGLRKITMAADSGCDEELMQALINIVAVSQEIPTYAMVVCGRHDYHATSSSAGGGAACGDTTNTAGGVSTTTTTPAAAAEIVGRPESFGVKHRRGINSGHRTPGARGGSGGSSSGGRTHSPTTRGRSTSKGREGGSGGGELLTSFSSHNRKRALLEHEERVIGPMASHLMHLLPKTTILVVRASAATAAAAATRRRGSRDQAGTAQQHHKDKANSSNEVSGGASAMESGRAGTLDTAVV